MGLADMRRQDRLGCHAVVVQKPIGGLQLGIVRRGLREAYPRPLRHHLHEMKQPRIKPSVPELSADTL
jgi:hypothetical protein